MKISKGRAYIQEMHKQMREILNSDLPDNQKLANLHSSVSLLISNDAAMAVGGDGDADDGTPSGGQDNPANPDTN